MIDDILKIEIEIETNWEEKEKEFFTRFLKGWNKVEGF